MEILGNVKTYEWGKLGVQSEVAQLAVLNSPDFKSDAETPYAELWMGDHISGPSTVKATRQELKDVLSPDLIGGHEKLPFLFKVLSVRKALSIQVHPNKEEAARLHSVHPDVYKDPNHKPELAIALTPFLAMCGFRPLNEISNFCEKLPPLTNLLGEYNVDDLKHGSSGLKNCFTALMNTTQDKIISCVEEILEKYTNVLKDFGLFETFSTINRDFPNDVGVLCLFFFNLINLRPGEAIYLPANEPHAYLEGDCIECMACSDNVIRAGLTPKFKDVLTLIKTLNYESQPPEKKIFKPLKKDSCLELFIPEVKDFAIAKLSIPVSVAVYEWTNQNYGSILLVLKGQRTLKTEKLGELHVKRGSIVFIPGNCGRIVEFRKLNNTDEDFIAYLAMYNSL